MTDAIPDLVCPVTTDAALRRAAVLAPGVEAAVGPDGRITFAALQSRVDIVRGSLLRAGVRHGDHVGICLGNGIRWIELFLAIGSVGAVAVPVNTRFRADEMAYALRQSRVKFLFVCDRLLGIDFIAMLREICKGVDGGLPDPAFPDLRTVIVIGQDIPAAAKSWQEFEAAGEKDTGASCSPGDTLLIQYTSGTTSFPKGVMLSHRSMLGNGFFAGSRMGLRAGDRFHSARPFFHVAGTSQSILACLQHAVTLVTMERFKAGDALALMERERCTHFSGNDTMALMLLDHPDRAHRRLSLRGAWLAAGPAVVRRAIDELGVREAVVAYGLSEASPNISISCWWDSEKDRVAGRMLPQPGVEVRIRAEDSGGDAAPGETGEIVVRGWNVMKGYFDKPAETLAVLDSEGWLRTGDLGRVTPEGRLQFVGRAKDVVRVGGENVAPAEVEDAMLRHPKIRMVQAVGVPDKRLGEVIAAFVVLREGAECTPEEIQVWTRDRMAGFKVPRHVRIVAGFEEIGMTASSKVQKKQLAAHAVKLLGLESS